MRNFAVLFVCLFLAASLSASGALLYKENGFSLSQKAAFTSVKVAPYEREIVDASQSPVLTFAIKNAINQTTNTFLDCGILTCDYKIRYTAKRDLQLSGDDISGETRFDYGEVWVEKIFYNDVHEVQYTRDTYSLKNVSIQDCVIAENETCFALQNVKTGTENYLENVSFENENIDKLKLKNGESKDFVIRFRRASYVSGADIYHTTFGKKYTDAAWWDATTINCPSGSNYYYAFSNTHSSAAAGTIAAINISLNTSISSIWNSTTAANVRAYINNTLNQTQLWIENVGSGATNTTLWIKAAAGENITLCLDSNQTKNYNNGSGVFSSELRAYPLTDLTEAKGTGYDFTNINASVANSSGKIGGAYTFTKSLNQYLNTSDTGMPTSAPFTVCWWSKPVSTPNEWCTHYAWGTGITAHQSETRMQYCDGIIGVNFLTISHSNLEYNLTPLAWTYDCISNAGTGENQTQIYRNGESLKNVTASTQTITLGSGLQISANSEAASPFQFFNGSIDDFRVWGSALSENQVAYQYSRNTTMLAEGRMVPGVITFVPPTPDDGAGVSTNTVYINVTTTFTQCNLTLNGTVYPMNTSGAAPNYECNANFSLADDTYQYSVLAYNNSTSNISSSNRTVTIDTVYPSNLVFLSPVPYVYYYLNTTVNLTFAASTFGSCVLSIDGTNYSMTQINSSLCQYNLTNQVGAFVLIGTVYSAGGLSNQTVPLTALMFNYSPSITYMNPELDISTDNMTLNLSFNGYSGLASAILQYNGTNYTAIQASPGFFYYAVLPPNMNGNTTVNFTWYYNLTLAYPVVSSSILGSTNVSYTNVTDCSSGGFKILNFTFYDQAYPDQIPMNSTMDASFTVITQSFSRNYSFSWSVPTTSVAVCVDLNNTAITVDSIQHYRATGYRNLYYYLVGASVNSANTSYISLYNLNVSTAYAVRYQVLQQSNQPVPNAYIQILRYYPATNQLLLVSMGKTDQNGLAQSYAIPNDVNYRYVVIVNGQIAHTTGISVLPCDPASSWCSTIIYLDDATVNEYTAFVDATGVGCAVNNATATIYCTSNNPSGTGTNLRLKVWKIGTYSDTLVCDNTVGTASGTVACTLADPTATYYYVGTSEIGSIIVIGNGIMQNMSIGLCAGSADCRQTSTRTGLYGSEIGRLAAVALIIVFAAFGLVAGVSASIIMAVFGLVFAALFGFIDIDIVVLSGVVISGFVVAWILYR